ncbi:uncharacterized protein [Rutidosis leptorrhynchoides]|uniref:uncharacterized protein n=1 Tax=Rutidosis leptorrhynchoides TaxID=125765 RepID=UPI003A9A4927
MEEMNKSKPIRKPQLEDCPQLIHRMQSLLAAKEAARTSVLSKSWLQAWSTIPTPRFTKSLQRYPNIVTEEETAYMNLIDNMLLRYDRDNIPIESFDLHFTFKENESTRLAEKVYSLPAVKYLQINTNVIKCVSLRVLELLNVHICEEILHNLLSTCSLLEKINLSVFYRSKMIRVKNLRYLEELQISSQPSLESMELDELPCLHSFIFNEALSIFVSNPISINMDSIGNVIELSLVGVIIDYALLDMIKSRFLFLESLTLQIEFSNSLKSMNITSLSLKRLTIRYGEMRKISLQVYAPELLHFNYTGFIIPSLVFSIVAPERIKVTLHPRRPMDYSFFLNFNEMLNLSTTFDIEIVHKWCMICLIECDFDIDVLRKSVPFPNMNMRRLLFSTNTNSFSFEHLQFFNAFFSVCHPSYVTVCEPIINASDENECLSNYLVNVVMKEIIKKGYWSQLKVVEIKNFVGRMSNID